MILALIKLPEKMKIKPITIEAHDLDIMCKQWLAIGIQLEQERMRRLLDRVLPAGVFLKIEPFLASNISESTDVIPRHLKALITAKMMLRF